MFYFSIHTLEVTQRITWETKHGAVKSLYQEAKKKKFKIYEYGCLTVCHKYQDQGMIVTFSTKEYNKFVRHYLTIRINPRRLIGSQTYVGLFELSETNIDTMIFNFNKAVHDIGYTFDIADINLFSITRLDLCCNLHVGSPALADLYMKLAKRANIPSKFTIKETYSKRSKRKKQYPNSLTLSTACMQLTLYNKQRQMEKDSFFTAEDIQEANSILRYELSLKRDIIRYYRQSLDMKNFLLSLNAISQKLLIKYAKQIFMTGQYHCLEDARSIVAKSNYAPKKKSTLLILLEWTAEHKQLGEILSLFRQKFRLSEEDSSKLLHYFNQLDLNPVTIPRRWNIKSLPGIVSLLEQQLPLFFDETITQNLDE